MYILIGIMVTFVILTGIAAFLYCYEDYVERNYLCD